jgi:3-phenylpropionate/cinnamic acid dioxygenase small subunit
MRSDHHTEIETFLYLEARLLDARRYRDWLDLLAEDISYWIPVRSSRFSDDTRAIGGGVHSKQGEEIGGQHDLAYMDDTKETLTMRVHRLETGTAWAEEPPSRTVHIITNILTEDTEVPNEVRVFSNFLCFRGRLETEEDIIVGCRDDLVRRNASGWVIARRKVVLAHNVLAAKNLSCFL